eukprot:scaffold61090_cov24-Prasinocladus_malaysianus.AAC.1
MNTIEKLSVTLLSTTTGERPADSALPSTNLVWLSAPSLASTSSTAPSTMPRTLQPRQSSRIE